MKITIRQDPSADETEVLVLCREINAEIEEIVSQIGLAGKVMVGRLGDETFFIPVGDVLYLESVDGNIFFYTDGGMYESTQRLYQLEEMLAKTTFARISKTAIANLSKMRSIKPIGGSRLAATMVNGEKVQVSRAYVAEIKKKLGV